MNRGVTLVLLWLYRQENIHNNFVIILMFYFFLYVYTGCPIGKTKLILKITFTCVNY